MEVRKICIGCGGVYIGSPQSRYCSKKCWRKQYNMTEKICKVCGTQIPDGDKRTKYCCDECKAIAAKDYKKAKSERKIVVPKGTLADDLEKARKAGMSYGKYKLFKERGILL